MGYFNVKAVLDYPGVKESFTLRHVSSSVLDDRGDAVDTTTDYSMTGSVQILTSEDQEVMEGRVAAGDIVLFVSDVDSNAAYFTNDDKIIWSSKTYRIVEVIKNSGHYEVIARKY